MDELRDFDLSVRVAMASSALCGDPRPTLVLKMQLSRADGAERTSLVELDEQQLSALLKKFAVIREELRATAALPS